MGKGTVASLVKAVTGRIYHHADDVIDYGEDYPYFACLTVFRYNTVLRKSAGSAQRPDNSLFCQALAGTYTVYLRFPGGAVDYKGITLGYIVVPRDIIASVKKGFELLCPERTDFEQHPFSPCGPHIYTGDIHFPVVITDGEFHAAVCYFHALFGVPDVLHIFSCTGLETE